MENRTATIMLALVAGLLMLGAPGTADAQFQPVVGQEGKDVIWVPTPDDLISAMLNMAKLSPNDYLIDLGSGDGRIVIAAAKRGTRAMGIEFNPDMVELSRANAEKAGVAGKATFMQGDIFATDFSQATVLTMYLLPDLNMKLRPTILNMKPGTRIVTHAFDMQDWQADQSAEAGGRRAFLWIVPANVAGIWKWSAGSANAELKLDQTYQKVNGTLKGDGKEVPLKGATLMGDQISFSAADGKEYSGRVNGSIIEGTIKAPGAQPQKWSAQRQ